MKSPGATKTGPCIARGTRSSLAPGIDRQVPGVRGSNQFRPIGFLLSQAKFPVGPERKTVATILFNSVGRRVGSAKHGNASTIHAGH